MSQTRGRLSEDGRWYFDGSNWHPVPTVDDPADLADTDDVRASTQRTVLAPGAAQTGIELVVDNAALELVNRQAQVPYVWTLVLGLLAALTPFALPAVTSSSVVEWAGRLDDAVTRLFADPVPAAATVAASLAIVALLRGAVWVRLYTSPLLQASVAVLAAVGLVHWVG